MFFLIVLLGSSEVINIPGHAIYYSMEPGSFRITDCTFHGITVETDGVIRILNSAANLTVTNSLFSSLSTLNNTAGIVCVAESSFLYRVCFNDLSGKMLIAGSLRGTNAKASQLSLFNVPGSPENGRRYPLLFGSLYNEATQMNASHNHIMEEGGSFLFADCHEVNCRQILTANIEANTIIIFYIARTMTGHVDQLVLCNSTQHEEFYGLASVSYTDNVSTIHDSVFYRNSNHTTIHSLYKLYVYGCSFDTVPRYNSLSVQISSTYVFQGETTLQYTLVGCFPMSNSFSIPSQIIRPLRILIESFLVLV